MLSLTSDDRASHPYTLRSHNGYFSSMTLLRQVTAVTGRGAETVYCHSAARAYY